MFLKILEKVMSAKTMDNRKFKKAVDGHSFRGNAVCKLIQLPIYDAVSIGDSLKTYTYY